MTKTSLWTATLSALLALGCASVSVPPERIAKGEAGIRAAEEVGANNVPNAKLHLQLARDQIEKTKKLSEQGDDRAISTLARAEADAELALELARENTVKTEAQRAMEEVKTLQNKVTP